MKPMTSRLTKEKPGVDENLLVEAARRGDRGAAKALYDRHHEQVLEGCLPSGPGY